ncbi:hypothetical protein KKB64_00260 [Patescibacteria group bacterium]|nr:hypothetical protein [Patescibacteria group bacterium]MBU1472208.1 hypothetical protein [Patescibacteria group bacterium]MBU2459602.1 hypothetical protein [Patescibacteria group bacterium]MBU2544522.1 hypothetical protein [Patescibacteria group bacterium]
MTPSAIVLLVLKICSLMGLGLYCIFAAIIVRQEQLMAHVLEEAFEPVLKLLTIIHLIASLGTFFLAIILL